jgi:hypothetical protein
VPVRLALCATAERLGLDRCRAAVKRIGGGEGRPGGETMCGLEEWVLPRTVRDLVRLVGQVGSHREYEHQ